MDMILISIHSIFLVPDYSLIISIISIISIIHCYFLNQSSIIFSLVFDIKDAATFFTSHHFISNFLISKPNNLKQYKPLKNFVKKRISYIISSK